MNKVAKISKETNAEKLRNARAKRTNNYAYMDNNQAPPYNKTNINKNLAQTNNIFWLIFSKKSFNPIYYIFNRIYITYIIHKNYSITISETILDCSESIIQ